MWRKSIFVSGLLSVCAAAYVVNLASPSAHALNFEDRWFEAATQKSDRLDIVQGGLVTPVVFLSVPWAQTTVALKQAQQRAAPKTIVIEQHRGSMQQKDMDRSLPQEISKDKLKEKLPVGCEPSFSPVTMPTMANISGRCLS